MVQAADGARTNHFNAGPFVGLTHRRSEQQADHAERRRDQSRPATTPVDQGRPENTHPCQDSEGSLGDRFPGGRGSPPVEAVAEVVVKAFPAAAEDQPVAAVVPGGGSGSSWRSHGGHGDGSSLGIRLIHAEIHRLPRNAIAGDGMEALVMVASGSEQSRPTGPAGSDHRQPAAAHSPGAEPSHRLRSDGQSRHAANRPGPQRRRNPLSEAALRRRTEPIEAVLPPGGVHCSNHPQRSCWTTASLTPCPGDAGWLRWALQPHAPGAWPRGQSRRFAADGGGASSEAAGATRARHLSSSRFLSTPDGPSRPGPPAGTRSRRWWW